MNYSLVSRDLIADCIETMYEAYAAGKPQQSPPQCDFSGYI